MSVIRSLVVLATSGSLATARHAPGSKHHSKHRHHSKKHASPSNAEPSSAVESDNNSSSSNDSENHPRRLRAAFLTKSHKSDADDHGAENVKRGAYNPVTEVATCGDNGDYHLPKGGPKTTTDTAPSDMGAFCCLGSAERKMMAWCCSDHHVTKCFGPGKWCNCWCLHDNHSWDLEDPMDGRCMYRDDVDDEDMDDAQCFNYGDQETCNKHGEVCEWEKITLFRKCCGMDRPGEIFTQDNCVSIGSLHLYGHAQVCDRVECMGAILPFFNEVCAVLTKACWYPVFGWYVYSGAPGLGRQYQFSRMLFDLCALTGIAAAALVEKRNTGSNMKALVKAATLLMWTFVVPTLFFGTLLTWGYKKGAGDQITTPDPKTGYYRGPVSGHVAQLAFGVFLIYMLDYCAGWWTLICAKLNVVKYFIVEQRADRYDDGHGPYHSLSMYKHAKEGGGHH